ncbi:uncharacterized protein MONBRDRAFT_33171 [Monosiga brevicollis MX1]|uniref:Cation-transporting P-type ATPase N-terminal domain-containing protein n=1 Tax=Monosiga brevicollis TaxID=81824 RepID=A9V3G8_MONBE|nr:uncharacterized protein MONBRDRAFT_33171 [Monosiga brevicollis MX1]EDQ87811.1 predicted protein [Monosiga brevicollis MX1]|eukprot:XP_001747344.1 hypothetical protein [Monosiga brevicollis MX1]
MGASKIPVKDLYGMVDPKSAEKLAELGGLDAIAKKLDSNTERGLSADKVDENRAIYGINKLPDVKFRSFIMLVWDALHDRTLIMLIIAACISLAVGMSTEGPELGWKDGVAVLVAVVLVVCINSGNDYQKEKQFRALNEAKNDHPVSVVRDGRTQRISIYDIVVGDIVVLQTGDIIPADGVFVSGEGVEADESSATGESGNVKKNADREPIFLSGTQIAAGNAKMLAICVGEQSFYGQVMLALRTPDEDTPLQEKLSRLADAIGNFGIIAAVFIFVIQMIKYFAINGSDLDGDETGNNVVGFLVIAISIVVVAVPEGLPLAVTIALGYSSQHMMRDHNLVRHLEACETMGGATTICSDKTGTLTQNKMAVVQGMALDKTFEQDRKGQPSGAGRAEPWPVDKQGQSQSLSTDAIKMFLDALALNSTAYRSENNEGEITFVGSKTETALLEFAELYGCDFELRRSAVDIAKSFPFSSDMKRMSVVVKQSFLEGNEQLTFHTKGAAEVVLKMCDRYITPEGKIETMSDDKRQEYEKLLANLNEQALRAICIAARGVDSADKDITLDDKPNLVCMAIAGIQDPLRPEVRDAVRRCQEAGVVVRMVTGDALAIAKSIGKDCGLFDETKDHVCLEGPKFREMTPAQIQEILPKLRILARSSPTDKFKLVSALQERREVVAVTGDGVNDGPALKKADVGFSMGLTGTDAAKEASAIVLMDDNFASIVNAIKWGRGIFDNIRKFLQFQLTVNFVAIIIVFVSIMADPEGRVDSAAVKPVQLLWINIIMDSFAALALATELPTVELLKFKPYDRNEPLFTRFVQRRMCFQIVMQSITLLTILFAGARWFDSMKEPGNTEKTQFSRQHYTIVFNTFVFSSLFNQLNCRKLRGELNVFAGLTRHVVFVVVWIISVIIQILIVEFGGDFVEVSRLEPHQWGGCIVAAAFVFVWSTIFNLLPKSITTGDWPWWTSVLDAVARCLPCLKSCHNPDKHDEQNYVSDDQDSQGQDTEPVQAHDLDAPAAAATGHQGSNDAALKSQSEAAPSSTNGGRRGSEHDQLLSSSTQAAASSGAHAMHPAALRLLSPDGRSSSLSHVEVDIKPDASPQLRRALTLQSERMSLDAEARARHRWQQAVQDMLSVATVDEVDVSLLYIFPSRACLHALP